MFLTLKSLQFWSFEEDFRLWHWVIWKKNAHQMYHSDFTFCSLFASSTLNFSRTWRCLSVPAVSSTYAYWCLTSSLASFNAFCGHWEAFSNPQGWAKIAALSPTSSCVPSGPVINPLHFKVYLLVCVPLDNGKVTFKLSVPQCPHL